VLRVGPPLKSPTRSNLQIVHHTLDVKAWIAAPPSVEAARPATCRACQAPSRPPGLGLRLHGHGVRERQLRGPLAADAVPGTVVLVCRRYRCTRCGAVLTVVPRGVAPRRHYGHAAIALAFALWSLVGMSVGAVRRRVCAWQISNEATRWPTLTRWAEAARTTFAPPIARTAAAARAAQQAIGRAPLTLRTSPREAQAFAGGSAMP